MSKLNAEASCVWNFKSSRLFQGKKYKFTFFVAENWAPYSTMKNYEQELSNLYKACGLR